MLHERNKGKPVKDIVTQESCRSFTANGCQESAEAFLFILSFIKNYSNKKPGKQ